MKRRGTRSPVMMANELVPIALACRLIGMDVPDDSSYGKSMKVHCPFGDVFHSDGGAETSFRIYPDTNSAYCFACKAYYSPVSLVATAWEQHRKTVAVELLARVGHKLPTPAEIWTQAAEHHEAPDRTLLAEALKTYCRRTVPDWDDLQFQPDTAAVLGRCLNLLSHVQTDTEAKQWLDGCKAIISRFCGSHVRAP